MSQSILQPGAPGAPTTDDWDNDQEGSWAEGSWVTDAGTSNASDGDDNGSTSRRRGKKKKKKKKKVVRSGIHALLKECRLEEFEPKLLDYGLENLEDIGEEGIGIEKQLFECGLKRGQIIRLIAKARRGLRKEGLIAAPLPPNGHQPHREGYYDPIGEARWQAHKRQLQYDGNARSEEPPPSSILEAAFSGNMSSSEAQGLILPKATRMNSPSTNAAASMGYFDGSEGADESVEPRGPAVPMPMPMPMGPGRSHVAQTGPEHLPHEGGVVRGPGAQTAYDSLHSRGGLGSADSLQSRGRLGSAASRIEDQPAFHIPVGVVSPLAARPPGLPAVDSHIEREDLKLSNLNAELRKARSKFLKRRRVKVEDPAAAAPKVSVAEAAGFSMKEIRRVLQYIDSMGEPDDGPSDGKIALLELDKAFRRAKRARAGKEYELLGRDRVYQLEELMQKQSMTFEEWFNEMDNSQGGKGDGTVSTLELRRGLASMTQIKKFRQYVFSEQDLTNLLRYMDPNGDGELDIQEVGDAIRRAHMDPDASAAEEKAGAIMKRLEEIMNMRQMRVIDLYRELDDDDSGSITLAELRDGLIKFAQPSGEERAMSKRAENAAADAEAAAAAAAEFERVLTERMNAAKKSGAYDVLLKLDAHMRKEGMRVIDLFSKSGFDQSGDGVLDLQEFAGAIAFVGITMSPSEVKVLLDFLDDSGDGEIEAFELEAAIRRLRKDMISNRATNAANAAAERVEQAKRDKAKRLQESTTDTGGGGNRSGRRPSDASVMTAGSFGTAVTGSSVTTAGSQLISLPRVKGKYKLQVFAGSQLDSAWLGSFDNRMSLHLSNGLTK